MDSYFGRATNEDQYGVIASWHQGQNGQCDFRVRVAAETLKRYPWADVLAEKRNRDPAQPPWGRWANPEDTKFAAIPNGNLQTGGVVSLARLFDELIRLGYRCADDGIVAARDAAREYMRQLLERWTGRDVWGRTYWDVSCYWQGVDATYYVGKYLMEHPREFPNWRNDARNIMLLFIHRTTAATDSNADVFSGAWAYPESYVCCARSLNNATIILAAALAEFGAVGNDEWIRELARRQFILSTYDCHETGVVEDSIDGGQIVTGHWFKIAHPLPLWFALEEMGWLPESLGANRENHIMRTAAVVNSVFYGKGEVSYSTFDAQPECIDVLRLAFRPAEVLADGRPLTERSELDENGFRVKQLPNKDCIVWVRHDGCTKITLRGDYLDSAGNSWRPGMELVVRAGNRTDPFAASWWTKPRAADIAGTADPELYRYGVHAPEFWVNVTVGPGEYDVRVKLCEAQLQNRESQEKGCVMNISINGREVAGRLNVAQQAGGAARALDMVFKNITPKNGVIEIRFTGVGGSEAMVQAVEVTPSKEDAAGAQKGKKGTVWFL